MCKGVNKLTYHAFKRKKLYYFFLFFKHHGITLYIYIYTYVLKGDRLSIKKVGGRESPVRVRVEGGR